MGVHKLWEILEPAKQIIPLESLVGQRLCIDLSYWIIQLSKVNGGNVKDKPHLRGLFHRIRALLALNCHLVFVTDGAIPALKAKVYYQRLAATNSSRNQLVLRPGAQSQCHAAVAVKRSKSSDFGRMIEDAKALATAFGFPCLISLEEGEAQCAALNAMGYCDACFTADSDSFLFGSKLVYKDISLGEGHVIAYDMSKVENVLGYGRNSLIALGILLGCDYFPGVYGLGPERAQQIVRKYGEEKILEVMLREGPVTLAKSLTKTSKTKCGEDKENLTKFAEDDSIACRAISAYANPKCHSKTSQRLQSVMLEGTLQLDQIRRICLQDFQWPFQRTDEYVLPRLAERDVHRSQSMDGVCEGLHHYKVSEIIKERRLRGVDYYEVRWEGAPAIPNTVLRVDDVQKAFPCKVAEFKAKTAAAKVAKGRRKREPKPKSVAPAETSLAELETAATKTTTSTHELLVSSMHELTIGGPVLAQHSEMNREKPVEVIDLTSPPPPAERKAASVSISSDEETSPDVKHRERVRELKRFIAGLKC